MRSKLLVGGLGVAVAFLLATSPVIAQAAGFITSGDIVNNTIKSKDVKDNTLKGKDVRDASLTAADLAAGTIPASLPPSGSAAGHLTGTYPSPTISNSAPGVALAGVATFGGVGPTVTNWFNREGGVPSISRTSVGNYTVTFPGMSNNVTTNTIAVGNAPGGTVSIDSSGGSLLIDVRDGAGAAQDSYFQLVVFAANTTGGTTPPRSSGTSRPGVSDTH